MLQGCWLLSDLDGTLISTPHKAKGKYLTVRESPCYEPLKRWLKNGGNLCVVTTADIRVVQQLYLPLREFLLPSLSHRDNDDKTTARGMLLISLFTGAVLYQCSAEEMVLVPRYIDRFHQATKESTILSKKFNVHQPVKKFYSIHGKNVGVSFSSEAVKGTCMPLLACKRVRILVSEIYMRYVYAILTKEPKVSQSIQFLSRRYKSVWKTILAFLHEMYLLSIGKAPCEVDTKYIDPFSRRTFEVASSDIVEWKMNFLRRCPGVFQAFGLLRYEFVKRVAYSTKSAHHVQSGVTDKIVSMLSAGFTGELTGEVKLKMKKFSEKTVASLGVEAEELNVVENSVDETNSKKIAQMILLGFPMCLYSTFFFQKYSEFVCIGVNCIPQPNSVVFSQLGISKSTALNYIMGNAQDAPPSRSKNDVGGIVLSAKSIALGDNPQASDYELTVFPDVYFVSVELSSQRLERHERIERRLARTADREKRGLPNTLPNGQDAPSLSELKQCLRMSGPMMDDRLWKNLLYVGGEEIGTSLLLTALMNHLGTPSENECHVFESPTNHAFKLSLLAAVSESKAKVSSQIMAKL